MEFLTKNETAVQAFAIALALNVLVFVGKFLWKLNEKKESRSDKNQEALSLKTESLFVKMAHLEGRMEHLINVISSYMENTISFASKLGAVERQLDHFSEKFEELSK